MRSCRMCTLLLCSLVLTLSISCEPPSGTRSPVKEVTWNESEFGSLAEVLGVKVVTGEFKLKQKVTKTTLRLDFYKNGNKLDGKSQTFGTGGTTKANAFGSGRYAVHFVDLDYLPLGKGKPEHLRIHTQLCGAGSMSVSGHVDVPKSVFDLGGRMVGTGGFAPSAAQSGEAPLFRVVVAPATNESRINHAQESVEKLVDLNPNADILVVVLEFE